MSNSTEVTKAPDLYERAITKLFDYTDKTIDFMSAQLPDVIVQLIHYKLAVHCFYTLISTALFVYLTVKVPKWYREAEAAQYSASTTQAVQCIAGTIFWLITCFTIISNMPSVLELLLAPKVYLLEYLKDMVHNS